MDMRPTLISGGSHRIAVLSIAAAPAAIPHTATYRFMTLANPLQNHIAQWGRPQ